MNLILNRVAQIKNFNYPSNFLCELRVPKIRIVYNLVHLESKQSEQHYCFLKYQLICTNISNFKFLKIRNIKSCHCLKTSTYPRHLLINLLTN